MKSDADILGFTEFGRNEDNIPFQTRPSTTVQRWCKSSCVRADWLCVYEPGGVMMIAKDKASAHVIAKGGDRKEMGRW